MRPEMMSVTRHVATVVLSHFASRSESDISRNKLLSAQNQSDRAFDLVFKFLELMISELGLLLWCLLIYFCSC